MYVQLRSIKDVVIDGNVARCHPGDWVDVGKQTALRWIAAGDAWAPQDKLSKALPSGAGLLIMGPSSARKLLGKLESSLQIVNGDRALPFAHTLLWNPDLRFPLRLLGAGFELLTRWQVVAPLWSYERLATTAGTEHARARAEELLHDLRVPLYDTRFVFARRSDATKRLLERWDWWEEELADERLAFLCAVYEVKPVICALPALDRKLN